MTLIDEVRKLLAEVQDNSAILLQTLEYQYPAWIIRKSGWYGIGVPYQDKEISERFSNVRIWSHSLLIGGEEQKLLLLTSDIEYLRYEFASICAEFAEPGKNGFSRKELVEDAISWWEKWRALLGNSVQNKMPYSVLGEMLIFKYLLENGKNVKWAAIDKSTHDIETSYESYEVKSTIKRYDSIISINSQHQLAKPKNGLYLCFCRFEESLTGISIEDIMYELIHLGLKYDHLNNALEKMGYEKGSSSRNKRYKLHEARKYAIDSSFPKITKDSFIDGRLPDSIVRVIYDVDLNGLKYSDIKISNYR